MILNFCGNPELSFTEIVAPVEPSPDEVVEEFLQSRKPAEEPTGGESETTEEAEYQALLDEEYALKLKEEELLAIGGCRRGETIPLSKVVSLVRS